MLNYILYFTFIIIYNPRRAQDVFVVFVFYVFLVQRLRFKRYLNIITTLILFFINVCRFSIFSGLHTESYGSRCNTNINFTAHMRSRIHIKSNDCLDRSVPILAVCIHHIFYKLSRQVKNLGGTLITLLFILMQLY